MRSNKRSRRNRGGGDHKSSGDDKSSSSEDEVEVVKAEKRNSKGVNKFSTGGGSAGSEARAAVRCARVFFCLACVFVFRL